MVRDSRSMGRESVGRRGVSQPTLRANQELLQDSRSTQSLLDFLAPREMVRNTRALDSTAPLHLQESFPILRSTEIRRNIGGSEIEDRNDVPILTGSAGNTEGDMATTAATTAIQSSDQVGIIKTMLEEQCG